ncbi:hypothetical protein CTAYLR_003958 [Chrysophaeum taylorii]|uniref:DUF4116 domain-containing protein n=1 Tax=Chrysophaeum taylorii TaxID=2483200 RepID=A0AAD7XIV5_9STRA|nr:hypothetical protein CTAYLR_003958 [Chrysophaeum taylorii]
MRWVWCVSHLVTPLDILSDAYQLAYFGIEGWWMSMALSIIIVHASWRFSIVYAAAHPKIASVRVWFVLYVPGLLLPCWDLSGECLRGEEPLDDVEALADVEERGTLYDSNSAQVAIYGVLSNHARAYESSSLLWRAVLLLRLEIVLFAMMIPLSPYVATTAAITLAREALLVESDRPRGGETHALYNIVLTFIEGSLESFPQLLLQGWTYYWAVREGTDEPLFGIPYVVVFSVSASMSALGILKAIWNFYWKRNEIWQKLPSKRSAVIFDVRDDPAFLQDVAEEFKEDENVVLAAVKQDGRALEYAAPELKGDKEVVLAAVKQDGRALEYAAPELKGDKEVVLAAAAAVNNNNNNNNQVDSDLKDPVAAAQHFRFQQEAAAIIDEPRLLDDKGVVVPKKVHHCAFAAALRDDVQITVHKYLQT